MGQVLACANQKGGVGKTTTVVNVATYLALAGERVLIIDLDSQGNATSGLGLDKSTLERSVYDAVIDSVELAELVAQTPVEHLRIVPASIALAGAEVELASVAQRERRPVRDQAGWLIQRELRRRGLVAGHRGRTSAPCSPDDPRPAA